MSEQRDIMSANMVRESNSFCDAKSSTNTLKYSEISQIKYDLIGKIAEGTVLTRKTVAAILQGISPIKFAEDLDGAKEVCVYAKLPKGFSIATPVGNYSPDWAIAFYEGTVKHIYFIAETKGTMESLKLQPIEKAKISCARKLFNEISTENVVYHDVDSYQSLLNIMNSIEK